MDVSRRDFLKGSGAAMGGLVAASALPAFADDPALFPQRGQWERLSIGYQHIVHCPLDTPKIWRAATKFWKRDSLKDVPDASAWQEPRRDAVTKEFVATLKAQPLLKGVLAGHYHIDVQDRFSPTAIEFLVGGNFLFHGQEITFS